MRLRFVLLTTLFLAGPLSAAPAAEFHKSVPLDATGSLSIDSHNGSVSVSTWNQPNTTIDARIEPAEFGGDDEDVQKTRIRVTGSGAAVHVETDYTDVPSHSSWFGFGTTRSLPLVHYIVRMPAGAHLEIEVHNATVKTDGLTAEVRIRAHNGGVTVRNQSGGANVETHNGDVRVEFARFANASRIETHNGSIDVSVPPDARLSVRTDSHRGRLSSDLPLALRASGEDASGTLNGGGPELRFVSHNGELHLGRR
jgi:hypothetical protein